MGGGVMSAGAEGVDMMDDQGGLDSSTDREGGDEEVIMGAEDLSGVVETGGEATSGARGAGDDSTRRQESTSSADGRGADDRGADEGCALSSSTSASSGAHLICLLILCRARRSSINLSRQRGGEI